VAVTHAPATIQARAAPVRNPANEAQVDR